MWAASELLPACSVLTNALSFSSCHLSPPTFTHLSHRCHLPYPSSVPPQNKGASNSSLYLAHSHRHPLDLRGDSALVLLLQGVGLSVHPRVRLVEHSWGKGQLWVGPWVEIRVPLLFLLAGPLVILEASS